MEGDGVTGLQVSELADLKHISRYLFVQCMWGEGERERERERREREEGEREGGGGRERERE